MVIIGASIYLVEFFGNSAEGFNYVDSGVHGYSEEQSVEGVWIMSLHYRDEDAAVYDSLHWLGWCLFLESVYIRAAHLCMVVNALDNGCKYYL